MSGCWKMLRYTPSSSPGAGVPGRGDPGAAILLMNLCDISPNYHFVIRASHHPLTKRREARQKSSSPLRNQQQHGDARLCVSAAGQAREAGAAHRDGRVLRGLWAARRALRAHGLPPVRPRVPPVVRQPACRAGGRRRVLLPLVVLRRVPQAGGAARPARRLPAARGTDPRDAAREGGESASRRAPRTAHARAAAAATTRRNERPRTATPAASSVSWARRKRHPDDPRAAARRARQVPGVPPRRGSASQSQWPEVVAWWPQRVAIAISVAVKPQRKQLRRTPAQRAPVGGCDGCAPQPQELQQNEQRARVPGRLPSRRSGSRCARQGQQPGIRSKFGELRSVRTRTALVVQSRRLRR